MHVREFVRLANDVGGIAAYAYLGDVSESPTRDKKTQAFEDSYLELLFAQLREFGFHAVTYMPSRNTQAQLERVMRLCEQYGFFQISGEDINSPVNPFCVRRCREYPHLSIPLMPSSAMRYMLPSIRGGDVFSGGNSTSAKANRKICRIWTAI